ncbi:MAG: hypothetical protein QOI04_747 [Verrucomicrobiota bacterium]|jgi:hypothetical protein
MFTNASTYKLSANLLLTLLLSSCANHHFQVIKDSRELRAPAYIDMPREQRVATLHFPAGSYYLYASDDVGYYYRAPRKIIEHTAGGSLFHNGGIYVQRNNPHKMRGYVFLPGGLTHVGHLAPPRHDLQKLEPVAPAARY